MQPIDVADARIAVHDGYRVSGRWSFASGCEHATWIYGNCIETAGDTEEDGPPQMIMRVKQRPVHWS